MIMIEELFERLDQLEGVDIQAAIDFMEEMIQGQKSDWYTADRKQRYQAMDFTQVHAMIDNSRGANLRKSLIDNKLRQLTPAVEHAVDYF